MSPNNKDQAIGWLNDLKASGNIDAAYAGLREFIDQATRGDKGKTPEELEKSVDSVAPILVAVGHINAAAFEDEAIRHNVGRITKAAADIAEKIAE